MGGVNTSGHKETPSSGCTEVVCSILSLILMPTNPTIRCKRGMFTRRLAIEERAQNARRSIPITSCWYRKTCKNPVVASSRSQTASRHSRQGTHLLSQFRRSLRDRFKAFREALHPVRHISYSRHLPILRWMGAGA